jgi:Rrf2 family protein
MKVSMKGDYGVRALIELAHHYGEAPVQSALIAARQSIPEPYLDQLLTSLRRAGIIRSVRGPQGGHALVRNPRDLKLSEAVIALEGSLAPISCLDDPTGCPKATHCSLHEVWDEVHRATIGILDGYTIADLAERERAREQSSPRYAI